MQRHEELEEIISPVVASASLEFVGMEVVPQSKSTLLRIYIDKPGVGITAEDCGLVSRQIDMELSVTEGHKSKVYILEVSSPGLDRILFNEEQLAANCGKKVRIKLQRPSETGQRNYVGTLSSVDSNGLTIIDSNGAEHVVKCSSISKVRLVPEW